MDKDLQEELYEIGKLVDSVGFTWLKDQAQDMIQERYDFLVGFNYDQMDRNLVYQMIAAASELRALNRLINLPLVQREVIRAELEALKDGDES